MAEPARELTTLVVCGSGASIFVVGELRHVRGARLAAAESEGFHEKAVAVEGELALGNSGALKAAIGGT